MRARTLLAALVILSLAAALGGYLWTPGRTPAGQPPLVTLTVAAVQEFVAAFDAAPSGPRILLLVSPT